MSDDGFGMIVEDRGPLYVTTDGGSHWTARPRVASPANDGGGLSAVALRSGVGFVLVRGAAGWRLSSTPDRGRTWRIVHRWRYS